jgi:hypothetical protein
VEGQFLLIISFASSQETHSGRKDVFSAWTEIMHVCQCLCKGFTHTEVCSVYTINNNDKPVKWESIKISYMFLWYLSLCTVFVDAVLLWILRVVTYLMHNATTGLTLKIAIDSRHLKWNETLTSFCKKSNVAILEISSLFNSSQQLLFCRLERYWFRTYCLPLLAVYIV